MDATLVAETIAQQLEGRISFRRAMKQAVSSTMRAGAEGIKVMTSGRLGGAEMARKEETKKGRIPLQTLRADIDFARETAVLPYGAIGVKVWIYRGDIFADRKANAEADAVQKARRSRTQS